MPAAGNRWRNLACFRGGDAESTRSYGRKNCVLNPSTPSASIPSRTRSWHLRNRCPAAVNHFIKMWAVRISCCFGHHFPCKITSTIRQASCRFGCALMVYRSDYFKTGCIRWNFADRDYFVPFGGLAGLSVFGFLLLRLLQLRVIDRANSQPDDVVNIPGASVSQPRQQRLSLHGHCSLTAQFGIHAVSAPVRRYLVGPRVVDRLHPNASHSIIAASWCFLPCHD
ncbi:hypothetical protein R1flu_012270 [Riccia fluitans]|uniref:Uncharacterized protein n=1 Tax=Riccia fluitans TaxID=41844 RepID=A0ABD1ZA48_9MARC